jgi:hypothetical protein
VHRANNLELLPPSGREVGGVEVDGRRHGVGTEVVQLGIWVGDERMVWGLVRREARLYLTQISDLHAPAYDGVRAAPEVSLLLSIEEPGTARLLVWGRSATYHVITRKD